MNDSAIQGDLFGKQPEEKKPGLVINIDQSRQNRDEGIKKAVSHANKENRDWSSKAYIFFIDKFLKENNGNFKAEDVRSYAALVDFPLPPSARAWGGIMMKARKDGFIELVGIGPVRNAKAHRANAGTWIRIK